MANWEAGVAFSPVLRLRLPAFVARFALDAAPGGAEAAEAAELHLGLPGLCELRELILGGGFTRLDAAPREFALAFKLPARPYGEGDEPFADKSRSTGGGGGGAGGAYVSHEEYDGDDGGGFGLGDDEDEDGDRGGGGSDGGGGGGGGGWPRRPQRGPALDAELAESVLAQMASRSGADVASLVMRFRAGEDFDVLVDEVGAM